MSVSNTPNSVHRYPFTAMQYLADLASTRNQHSIPPNSQSQQERKMNDDNRNQPLQSATLKATRYVPINKYHSLKC